MRRTRSQFFLLQKSRPKFLNLYFLVRNICDTRSSKIWVKLHSFERAACKLPDSASWHPEGFVLLLLNFVGNLVAEEDEVCPALDHVGDQGLVLRLQLLGVLKDVLRVLVGHLFSMVSGVFDLKATIYIQTYHISCCRNAIAFKLLPLEAASSCWYYIFKKMFVL